MKRVLAYIVMAVVALAAFKGVAEGVEYIAENGIAVTMASDSLYNSAPVMAMIAAMALLLPLFSFSDTLLAKASISEERHKILFPFHSFW